MSVAAHGGSKNIFLSLLLVHRDSLQTDGLLLVAVVLPTPTTYGGIATPTSIAPRGVKRSRTPDQRGNARADGDHDDGMCASESSYDSLRGIPEAWEFLGIRVPSRVVVVAI